MLETQTKRECYNKFAKWHQESNTIISKSWHSALEEPVVLTSSVHHNWRSLVVYRDRNTQYFTPMSSAIPSDQVSTDTLSVLASALFLLYSVHLLGGRQATAGAQTLCAFAPRSSLHTCIWIAGCRFEDRVLVSLEQYTSRRLFFSNLTSCVSSFACLVPRLKLDLKIEVLNHCPYTSRHYGADTLRLYQRNLIRLHDIIINHLIRRH